MENPKTIAIRQVDDLSGSLSFLEVGHDIPFAVRRVYFLHGIKDQETRGGHAHKELWQVIIAVSGSFRLSLRSAGQQFNYALDSPRIGVLVPPMWWRTLSDFSDGSVCLVLASEVFEESDYIRDYQMFLARNTESEANQPTQGVSI